MCGRRGQGGPGVCNRLGGSRRGEGAGPGRAPREWSCVKTDWASIFLENIERCKSSLFRDALKPGEPRENRRWHVVN